MPLSLPVKPPLLVASLALPWVTTLPRALVATVAVNLVPTTASSMATTPATRVKHVKVNEKKREYVEWPGRRAALQMAVLD